MRVLHIIPAAFTYFDKIRDRAFQLIEAESKTGIEVEVFVLQYGSPSERFETSVRRQAPSSRRLTGTATINEVIATCDDFDLINVHVPLLGAAPQLLRLKKRQPHKPLVVTYHGKFSAPDLFGAYISCYNVWYTAKLFKAADAIVALESHPSLKQFKYVLDLTVAADTIQLEPEAHTKALYYALTEITTL